MPYTHSRHGHSETANAIADEVCDILNRVSDEAYQIRLAQIEAGTAPATPWQFDIWRLAWGALCANRMDTLYVESPRAGWNPTMPCPRCQTVHPQE